MRIVHVTPFFLPQTGGVELYVYHVVKELKRRGHEVAVLTVAENAHGKPLPQRETIDGIPVYRFPAILRMGRFARFWPGFLQVAKHFDIIHVHGFRHPHTILSLLLKLGGRKVIMTTHSPFHPRKGIERVFVKIFDLSVGWYWRLMDYIIMTNDEERFFFKGIVLPTANVSAENIKQREKYGTKILYLGRLDPLKGVDDTIRILALLPKEYTLSIVGPEAISGYRDHLRGLATRLGVEKRVTFRGPVYGEEKWKVLDEHDFLLLPSPYEASGIVVVEALARGLVPIVKDSPGPRTIKRYCRCVKLFDSIEEAANLILQSSPCLCDVTPLTWEKHVDMLEEIYSTLTP